MKILKSQINEFIVQYCCKRLPQNGVFVLMVLGLLDKRFYQSFSCLLKFIFINLFAMIFIWDLTSEERNNDNFT